MRAVLLAPLSLFVLLGAGPALASPAEVLKCAGIKEDAARLACYDRTVPGLTAAGPAVKPVAPPAPPVPPEKRFGAERLAKEDRPPAAVDEVESINATLKEAYERSAGRWVFTLDNGQVWQQVVSQSLYGVKPGRKVSIEKSMFGSYTMRIDGIKSIIKVTRAK